MQSKMIIYTFLLAVGILFAPILLQAQSNGNRNQIDTIKNKNHMNYKVNIGNIIVPKEAIEEFKKQSSTTPLFLKTLPGYVKGDYYETLDEAGNLYMISVTTWGNESYYNNAQMELKKYYEQLHFNRMEFAKRLNLVIEHRAYNVKEIE